MPADLADGWRNTDVTSVYQANPGAPGFNVNELHSLPKVIPKMQICNVPVELDIQLPDIILTVLREHTDVNGYAHRQEGAYRGEDATNSNEP